MGIREDMPILARHEGVWEGVYRYYDADGNKTDEHKSRLVCRFPDTGDYPYHQVNYYTWADGKTETRDFPAKYAGGRIWWDNDLIKGWAGELKMDDLGRTVVLYWQRQSDASTYLYEMIQISDCGKFRGRTWHWISGGKIVQRTIIDEHKVSDVPA